MKALIIEDDTEIAEFISIAFNIGWPDAELILSHQGQQAIELAETESPDIILLDLSLPDISGFNVLKNIRSFSEVPIIIETVRGNEADIVKGLNLGADEYLVKPFGQLELLARVKAIFRSRQQKPVSSMPIVLGPLKFDPSSYNLYCGSNEIHLTPTECIIIFELMVNIGNLVTYTQLAEVIWGDYYPNAPDTLRVYIKRLRSKIETETKCPRLIFTKHGLGYIMQLPTSD